MINWFSIILIPFGVLLGMELRRYNIQTAGKIYVFQPLNAHRAFSAIIIFAVVCFLEAARVSLVNPTTFHLWVLILSSTVAQLFLVIREANENKYIRRKLST